MRHFVAALVLLLSPFFAAQAADASAPNRSAIEAILKRGELRVGMEAGYIPFEMRDKKGDIIGFDVDLARLMARAMGVKVTFVNTQWDGIIPALLTDKFDILMGGMTITPERNLQVNFATPYIVIGQTLMVSKRSADKIKSIKDANDPQFTIGTKLGTTGDIAAKRFLSKAKIKTYETQTDAALEVRSGRIDAMVYDLPFNTIYANQNRDSIVHLKEPFTYEPLGWAVRKGDPDFLNWLDNFLNQIRHDGTYDALYAKWFEGTAWMANIADK